MCIQNQRNVMKLVLCGDRNFSFYRNQTEVITSIEYFISVVSVIKNHQR